MLFTLIKIFFVIQLFNGLLRVDHINCPTEKINNHQ